MNNNDKMFFTSMSCQKIMKKVAQLFKDRRKVLGMTAEEVAKGICDIKTLYNMENGKTSMNYGDLFRLFKKVDLAFEEVGLAIGYDQYKINNYCYENNIKELEKILAEKRDSPFLNNEDYVYILMISAFLNEMKPDYNIPEKDLEKAADYFMDLNYWGYSEMVLFCNTLNALKINLVILITQELTNQIEEIHRNYKKKNLFIRILINVSYACLQHHYLAQASYFLNHLGSLLKTQLNENNMFERQVFKFMKGYYYLLNGKKQKGLEMMNTAIGIFAATESFDLVERYRKYLVQAVAQAEEKLDENQKNKFGNLRLLDK
ncbi:MAG: hypothetical protein LBS28_02525 [Streptococcaceae bacterium]|jgi:Rgg/GadR/MutR family transcriptional activator|nr:hypothetical protein [Streptococcaceae bacterium]